MGAKAYSLIANMQLLPHVELGSLDAARYESNDPRPSRSAHYLATVRKRPSGHDKLLGKETRTAEGPLHNDPSAELSGVRSWAPLHQNCNRVSSVQQMVTSDVRRHLPCTPLHLAQCPTQTTYTSPEPKKKSAGTPFSVQIRGCRVPTKPSLCQSAPSYLVIGSKS